LHTQFAAQVLEEEENWTLMEGPGMSVSAQTVPVSEPARAIN
jgi:hypothetical protein